MTGRGSIWRMDATTIRLVSTHGQTTRITLRSTFTNMTSTKKDRRETSNNSRWEQVYLNYDMHSFLEVSAPRR